MKTKTSCVVTGRAKPDLPEKVSLLPPFCLPACYGQGSCVGKIRGKFKKKMPLLQAAFLRLFFILTCRDHR